MAKENLRYQRLAEQQNCDTCIEYIKKIKGMEFKINDLMKDKESHSNKVYDLSKAHE